jgi:hypothetical protein
MDTKEVDFYGDKLVAMRHEDGRPLVADKTRLIHRGGEYEI